MPDSNEMFKSEYSSSKEKDIDENSEIEGIDNFSLEDEEDN